MKKKYSQEEVILALDGDRDGMKGLSACTGISENTLRQYRRSARGMSAPVSLLFRLLIVLKKEGKLTNVVAKAGCIKIYNKKS